MPHLLTDQLLNRYATLPDYYDPSLNYYALDDLWDVCALTGTSLRDVRSLVSAIFIAYGTEENMDARVLQKHNERMHLLLDRHAPFLNQTARRSKFVALAVLLRITTELEIGRQIFPFFTQQWSLEEGCLLQRFPGFNESWYGVDSAVLECLQTGDGTALRWIASRFILSGRSLLHLLRCSWMETPEEEELWKSVTLAVSYGAVIDCIQRCANDEERNYALSRFASLKDSPTIPHFDLNDWVRMLKIEPKISLLLLNAFGVKMARKMIILMQRDPLPIYQESVRAFMTTLSVDSFLKAGVKIIGFALDDPRIELSQEAKLAIYNKALQSLHDPRWVGILHCLLGRWEIGQISGICPAG